MDFLLAARKISLKLCLMLFIGYLTLAKCAQNYGGNYDWRMLGGGPLQVISFQVGTSSSLSHGGRFNYSIGGSIGWNYLSSFYNLLDSVQHIFDVGLRFKYQFSREPLLSHSIGVETYFHLPFSTTQAFKRVPQPLSLILGAGGTLVRPDKTRPYLGGGYVEVGLGLAKFFPINVNLIYRWSFFEAGKQAVEPLEQSLHIDFILF